MTATFDTGEDFTTNAVRRALRGEAVETYVDPEILREIEAFEQAAAAAEEAP